ncbi:efflux RND transporter periplasmic adaptor subunit [Myroides marinus]|uniref:efflux RND transporter periplasmic adaptor subunit n=1 Tax=Myroides marinus TaxID=703342 RepID=UPI002577C2DA|nr:efflux RND transporter periplasmic adaptor subunit [Myroides marinus]MDM1372253.1 efflux RND transporter periplasmic adaptor subunit [Myroides marinus]MDM1380451.1 efflux RND transporter periplasmic adaptor subunit [Myroides marinus]MDM1387723.1 efflux RND transporter periplasmic adaptor subunit [Myroides marinus]MDM1394935.1 efflux RND transporter periplasmic adaptor subunit [Myroides marinus]
MKKSIIFLSLATSILLFSCKKDETENKEEKVTTEVNAKEEANANVKEVELNEAQYSASKIQLGQILQKNLSDVVRINGTTELPAQSQADVSSFLSGTITNINVNLGDYVKKGQTIATIDSPEYIQLQEEYIISKNTLEYLELEFKRQQTLRAENVNSEKTFQKTKSDLNIERARYQSLSNRLSLVNSSPSSISKSLRIVSPISGNIATIPVKIGTNIMAGQSLFTIVDNSQIHLDLLVYEKDMPYIKVGQKVSFTFTNIDKSEVTATIFSINKSFEPGTKTVLVHANIDKVPETLIPGLYVNALVHIGEKTVDALPNEAIVKADGREFIFILEDAHEEEGGKSYHFQRIEAKTGVSELGYTQVTILQQVPKDSQIVLSGAYYIQSHLIKTEGGGGHSH